MSHENGIEVQPYLAACVGAILQVWHQQVSNASPGSAMQVAMQMQPHKVIHRSIQQL